MIQHLNILICPDKFKGSLTAEEVCQAIAKSIRKLSPGSRISQVPMADGGEGSLEIINNQLKAEIIRIKASDPLGRPVEAEFLMKGDNAYIEMAKASGLQLLKPEERSATRTSTEGTGELIREAIQFGAKKIYLLVGGSATNDAGIGMAKALGFGFSDAAGNEVEPTGENMIRIKKIHKSLQDFGGVEFSVLCDVENPLYGKNGAAHVFGRQKGADDREIAELDEGLKNMSELFRETFGVDVQKIPGAGAAGGIAGGAVAFLGAEIKSGIGTLMEIAELEDKIKAADLVITGEGKIDSQTLNGKVIAGIAAKAGKYNKTVLAFCGKLDLEFSEVRGMGLIAVFPIKQEGMSDEDAMEKAGDKLEKLAEKELTGYIKHS
ncbi:glycerate kinase [Emticicia sp. CRIBPO]|uniref:glycerate kinase n=1 Tax=Emticicia sp. CRIBPO TaxID=2683258 RepID=UPI001412A004|nr:glycerate kinase [Emticicia sp. CRIBPO]NBA87110.1 glycerate kinase [Emticicia sp. CRIBPO]